MSNYFVKSFFDSEVQSSENYDLLEDACEFAMSQFTKNFSSKKDLKVDIYFNETLMKSLTFVECVNNYESLQRYYLDKIFN
jgi:hypothetical protein